MGLIAEEHGVENTGTASIRQKLTAVADQSSRGNLKLSSDSARAMIYQIDHSPYGATIFQKQFPENPLHNQCRLLQ